MQLAAKNSGMLPFARGQAASLRLHSPASYLCFSGIILLSAWGPIRALPQDKSADAGEILRAELSRAKVKAGTPATLPQPAGPRGRVRLPVNPEDEAAILAEDSLIPREQFPTGPMAKLSLFGSAPAVGRSFVFVVDRSNSMALGAIQTAAKELGARLVNLRPEQKMQIVAYNDKAAYLTGRELIPATDENKRNLITFISGLEANGQTAHSRGVSAALRLKPEVMFLLTDGGDPLLSPGDLLAIRDENAGRTEIHCVQFGRGPVPPSADIFKRLAAQNRGGYTYVDLNSR